MDVFYEQIISVNRTKKQKLLSVLIYAFAVILSVVAVFGALKNFAFVVLYGIIIASVWFLAYKLVCNFNIEYEYTVTNGELDIDVIINKSKRKNIASIECKNIESVKKFNSIPTRDIIVCCNMEDDAYMITARSGGKVLKLVIAPNEKIKMGMNKFLPRIVVKDAFI